VAETDKNSDETKRLVTGLSEAQLSWTQLRELEHCQCLDHLATTSKAFEPYLTAAIKRGRDKWP